MTAGYSWQCCRLFLPPHITICLIIIGSYPVFSTYPAYSAYIEYTQVISNNKHTNVNYEPHRAKCSYICPLILVSDALGFQYIACITGSLPFPTLPPSSKPGLMLPPCYCTCLCPCPRSHNLHVPMPHIYKH